MTCPLMGDLIYRGNTVGKSINQERPLIHLSTEELDRLRHKEPRCLYFSGVAPPSYLDERSVSGLSLPTACYNHEINRFSLPWTNHVKKVHPEFAYFLDFG